MLETFNTNEGIKDAIWIFQEKGWMDTDLGVEWFDQSYLSQLHSTYIAQHPAQDIATAHETKASHLSTKTNSSTSHTTSQSQHVSDIVLPISDEMVMLEGAMILDRGELPSCSDWDTVNSVFGIPKELSTARKKFKAITTHRLVINAKIEKEKLLKRRITSARNRKNTKEPKACKLYWMQKMSVLLFMIRIYLMTTILTGKRLLYWVFLFHFPLMLINYKQVKLQTKLLNC